MADAVDDALVKPAPGNLLPAFLAHPRAVSADQRMSAFTLRQRLTFHAGDSFTAEDAACSFLRGKACKPLHDKVQEGESVDPSRMHFHLREPWLDFVTF